LLLLHGFPSGSLSADSVGKDQPELADRIAIEMGWTVLTIRLRGCGTSTGDFSLGSWVDDARAGFRHLRSVIDDNEIWFVGFGTGGAVGLTAAADDDAVVAGALVATPADFDDWAKSPERLLAHAHEVGVIKTPAFPEDLAAWKAELASVRATTAAELFAPRPLLVVHGSEDEAVPPFDARMVADAHGTPELRIISGAGHQLRHDPRAIAVVLGWLERSRSER
jgi:putative redox protein